MSRLRRLVVSDRGFFITCRLGYNTRLLPASISASSSNGTALSLSYSYFGNGGPNVITNNRDNGRTVTYGYDSLNRWNSASSQAPPGSGADCWGQSVPAANANPPGYDRYGNLLTINVSKCSAPGLSISVSGNNQVSGYTYNAAGDVTYDGTYNYSWDAENRLTSTAGVTYTYDGDGQRVKKSSGTLYWRGGDGSAVAETDTSGNTLNEYVFFGARIARRDSSGNVYYYFGNHLGSAAITNATGTLCYDADFYPIGGELAFTNNCSQNYKFAGMEQDPETGDYHALFRQYSPSLGRWLSPDPLAGSISNPQSLNRYAYVMNNPTTLTDPTGLTSVHCYYCAGAYGTGTSMEGYLLNGGTFSPIGPPGSGDNPGGDTNAAAEAQYVVNICPSCSGISYTSGGLTYTWVPPTFSHGGGVIRYTTGYWSMGSVNDLGFFGQLKAYVNDALDAIRNWTSRQLAPPPGVSIGIVLPPGETWGNSATLEQHFWDHGADFGSTSPSDYAQQASDFLVQSQADSLPTKIDTNGVIYVYDPSTNTFGAYNADGTTRTFFEPTSPSYFARQPGAIVPGH